jgi:acyl-CoA hydrolase
MENYHLVRPEHLNQYGFLFGGYLLMWVDETAWLSASIDYPACKFVTVGMDHVDFKKSVKNGAILRFSAIFSKSGNTSVSYHVKVYDQTLEIFCTQVTLVRIDDHGIKTPLPKK